MWPINQNEFDTPNVQNLKLKQTQVQLKPLYVVLVWDQKQTNIEVLREKFHYGLISGVVIVAECRSVQEPGNVHPEYFTLMSALAPRWPHKELQANVHH